MDAPPDQTESAAQSPATSAATGFTFARASLLASYGLLACVLAYVVVARYFLPLYVAEPIGVVNDAGSSAEQASASMPTRPQVEQKVDPNTASWSELTRLPGIGEVMAKRIVQYREDHTRDDGKPVFETPEDLAHVRGIGPKTVEKLRPQLKGMKDEG